MPPAACPGAAPLRQYLEGHAAEADAARLEEHIAGCPPCLRLLAGMAGDDELARAAGGPTATLQQPQLRQLLQKIRRRKPAPVSPALLNTEQLSMSNTEPSLLGGNADEMSHFLAPAQGPGELGRLGGYRVLKVLGAGGMGTVYEAEDLALRRRVALKTMKPSAASQPAARERFLREARAAAALSHDYIVPIYQVGEDRNVPYLAMALLHGEMLEDRLKRQGRLSVPEALRIGREVAEGLAAAHDHGIIHRDIKPGNIWLESPTGRVKIVDFGLASGAEGDVQLTTPGTVLGTPAYMAPEQAGGPVDHRADLFSLGCVLYRMTTGRLPFPGSSTMEILRNIAVQQPRPPRELNPEIPAPLEQFMLRLLAKERDQRPVSAAVTARVLTTLEQHLAATVHIPPGHPPAAAHVQAGPPPLAKLAPPPPSNRAPPNIRNAPPPLNETIQHDPKATPVPAPGAAASLTVKMAALPAWFKAQSPRRKLILAGSVGGALAACLLVGLALMLWGGGRPRPSNLHGDNGGNGDGPGVGPIPPPKFVRSPGKVEIKIQPGDALNANSLVTRPADIKGLETWDIFSDHIANKNPGLVFGRDGLLNLGDYWNFEKGALVPPPFAFAYSAISPDQKTFARVSPQSVQIFETDKPDVIARSLPTSGVTSVAWSNNGDYLATYGTDGLRIWHPFKAKEYGSWNEAPAENGSPGVLAWAPDNSWLLAWRPNDYAVYEIEAPGGKVAQKISIERFATIRPQFEGEMFATVGYSDNKIRVYDLKSGKLLSALPDASNTDPAWSIDGKMLAFGVGKSVQIWTSENWNEPKLLRTVDQPRQRSKSVVFAPHGDTLFSYDADGKLRLWDVKTGLHRGTIVVLDTGGWLAVTAEGDYRASDGAEEAGLFRFQVVDKKYTNDLAPKKFAEKYGWVNDPKKPLEALR